MIWRLHYLIFLCLGLGTSRELGPNLPWSLNKWVEVYENSVYALYKRYQEAVKKNGVLSWDKVITSFELEFIFR